MTDILKLGHIALDECKKREPCEAEICADDSSEMKVVFENTDFSVASSSHGAMIGLRVISKNRLGFVTTNATEEKDIRDKAREAQMIAGLSPASPYHAIAPKQKSGSFAMAEDKLAAAAPKDLLRWAEVLVNESRLDKRVALDRAEVNLQTNHHVILNSNGVEQSVKQTICSWYVMGMAKDGSEVTSFDYDGNSSVTWADMESRIKETAREFRESVLGSLGATSGKSYKGPVLFHPAAIASLLAGHIGFNVNARGQQDGMSKWAGKTGEIVASPEFNFISNPLDETRPSDWSPFDREGVASANYDVIKDGKLNFTAHNMFTATRGKVVPTGNAAGGSRSMPSIGMHGLSVGAGKTSEADLYAALNNGLVLKRFSGNTDPVSGQFSGVAKNSWWVENGKRTASLKEVMISGNMFDLLKDIKLIGSKIHRLSGSFDSPYILIDGVSVTAG
jgi:PmbA protein